MNRSGLYLEEASMIPTHGGSYRLIFGKSKLEQSFATKELISWEAAIPINPKIIASAILRYEAELRNLDRLLESLHAEGGRIIAFGASGRANMLLGKLSRSRKLIEKVIDESPERFGRLMAQNQIPIVPLSGLDYSRYTTLVVLAWNYSESIIKRLENTQLDFIIPLPTLMVITSNHRKDERA
jgi:methylation protein EvaC